MLRALALLLALVAGAAGAQEFRSILVLDQERLFAESAYGRRVQAELDAAGQALASENRSIEAELVEEELALTEARETMPRDEFMVLAEEFDLRVEGIRAEQDAKARALSTAIERAQVQFFDLVVPILLQIAQEREAAAILDSRTVLLAAEQVDITDAAVAAVDAAIGEGPEAPILDLSPEAAPEPEAVPDPGTPPEPADPPAP